MGVRTNAAIETASMGVLTQALGISAKATVQQVGIDEATKALQRLANQELTPRLLMETAEGAARNTLGVIGRPQELTGISRLLTGIGGRLKRGLVPAQFEANAHFLRCIMVLLILVKQSVGRCLGQ